MKIGCWCHELDVIFRALSSFQSAAYRESCKRSVHVKELAFGLWEISLWQDVYIDRTVL